MPYFIKSNTIYHMNDHNKYMRQPIAKRESVLKATYEILKHANTEYLYSKPRVSGHQKYSGVATFIFRTKLMERLHEYNEDIIRDLEEILIQYEWILKDKKTKVLIPTKKLLYAAESKLLHFGERTTIPVSSKISQSRFLRI